MSLFYVHIMKTGGTSLLTSIFQRLGWEHVWGQGPRDDTSIDPMVRYTAVAPLAELDDDERARYQVFAGHLPFVASELVPGSTVAVMLRDPVERTISYLAHCRRDYREHRDLPLEAIYEDEWYRPRYILDHQTKVMAMTLAEALTPTPPPPVADAATTEVVGAALAGTAMLSLAIADPPIGRVIPLEGRLDEAVANLDRVDILGVDHGRFVTEVAAATGLPLDHLRLHTRPEMDVPASLRRRIADENALDMALWEAARQRAG